MKTYIKFNACNPKAYRYWIEQHPDPSFSNPIRRSLVTYITREQYKRMWKEGSIINVASLECPVEICRPLAEWRAEQEIGDNPLEQVQVEIYHDTQTEELCVSTETGVYEVIYPDVVCLPAFALDHSEGTSRYYTTQRRWMWALYDEAWYKIWQAEHAKYEARVTAYDERMTQPRKGSL